MPSSVDTSPPLELFESFFQKPDKDSFLAVREAVCSHPDYDPFSPTVLECVELREGEDFGRIPKLLQGDMMNTLLSPLAHLINRDVFDKQDEKGKAVLEHQVYLRCVEGILSAGDGSMEAPYPVLRLDDIGDVLRHLEKLDKHRFDRVLYTGGRYLEVYQVEKQPLVFDVTAPYQWLERWLGEAPESMKSRLPGFFLHPSIGEFLQLRAFLANSEVFNPYTSHLKRCNEALACEDWSRVERLVLEDMPNLILSPRAHQLLSRAAAARGDISGAGLRMQFAATLHGLLMETGDGSSKRPWLCLREEDEADIMGGLGLIPVGYKAVGGEERYLEHLVLEDGRSFFMDMTVPFTHVNRLFSVD